MSSSRRDLRTFTRENSERTKNAFSKMKKTARASIKSELSLLGYKYNP